MIRKVLVVRVLISFIFLLLIVVYETNLWGFKIDTVFLILLVLLVTPWATKFVESIELGGLKIYFKKDILEANRKVENVDIKNGEEEIKWKNEFTIDEKIKNFTKYLSFKARVNYPHEAGAYYLLQVKINDIILDKSHIINREHGAKIANGRIRRTFMSDDKTWNLVYSPDFISNYTNEKYKVLNFDPYLFVFDISKFTENNTKIKITLSHIGPTGNDAFKNPIIIRDLVTF